MKHLTVIALTVPTLFALADTSTNQVSPDQLLLKDYRPRVIHKVPHTTITRARFPVIDVHSHPYAKTKDQIDQWVRTITTR